MDKLDNTKWHDRPLTYQVRLQGHLQTEWSEWFDQVTIKQENRGITCLVCTVSDQAALHGLLKKVRDIGAPLISIVCLNPELNSVVGDKEKNDHTRYLL